MKARMFFGYYLLGLACLALFGGCASTPPSESGHVMTGEEIKSLLTHTSEETTTSAGGIFRAYRPDSETEIGRYTEKDGKTFDVKARLTYKDHAVCSAWDRKEWGFQCYQLVQDGEKIVYRNLKDKNDFGQIKILDGNPFGF